MIKKKRSIFDLSHRRKFSCDMGYLVPCYVEEILPGDSFKVHSDLLLRLTPLMAPIMHEVNVFTHFWFVPNRLIWKEWESFITGGFDGISKPLVPTLKPESERYFCKSSLSDYLGFPVCDSFLTLSKLESLHLSALYHRAYNLIWNEWYRDQNLQDPISISLDSGVDNVTSLKLLRRNWKKDYFTSSLPWPQRGPSVSLPLNGDASVDGDVEFYDDHGSYQNSLRVESGSNYNNLLKWDSHGRDYVHGKLKNAYADLSSVTAATINDLRQAFSIQRFMEISARGGARYTEAIKAHFGVSSSDSRLQRPEYLGGGRSPIVISEVLQTSSTDNTSPQGNMSGHGYSLQRSHSFKRYFEEHGIILGLISIMPKPAYFQGVDRRFSRSTKFDYFWPELAHIGEQEIKVKELYAAAEDPDRGFGYQPRYQEYRFRNDTVHGDFKDNLNFWHMAREFYNEPKLNSNFIECNPTKRISVIPSEANVYIDMLHKVSARRIIPKYGAPAGLF